MKILYVPKSEIYPMLGCYISDGTIKIREDLPKCVKDFLLVHETYHSTDTETNWIKREIGANLSGLKAHPIGALLTLLASITPGRITYYFRRWREGK